MNYDDMKGKISAGGRQQGDHVECEVCKRTFVLRKMWQRFCSTGCRLEYHRVKQAYARTRLNQEDL